MNRFTGPVLSLLRLFCGASVAMFGSCGTAVAHGVLAGGHGFYAGAAHPFLAIEHALVLIGFGLVIGRPDSTRLGATTALSIGVAAGVAACWAGFVVAGVLNVILFAALASGGLLASGLPLHSGLAVVFGASLGFSLGIDTDVMAASSNGMATAGMAALGVLAGILMIALNSAALAALAVRPPWSVALRVAGSWIAAVALMALAFEFHRSGVFA